MNFIKAKISEIRTTFGGEAFVQKLLADDPSVLGLGDLYLRGRERVQASSGRLDLLFESPDGRRWYEVEVQLGATDETHIIRTIEYWDNERRSHPEKEHVAVIVAEHITKRFFNVIALFNKQIPIVAIQMTALEVEGHHTISFTRILDHSTDATRLAEEEDFEPADRVYWVKRTSENTMKIVDAVLALAERQDASSFIKYNKGYIAIKKSKGELRTSNFISIRPRKKEIRLSIASPKDGHLERQLEATTLQFEYDEGRERYFFYFSESEYPSIRDTLNDAVRFAYGAADKTSEESLPEDEA